MASSKSLASTGSIVMVKISRISFLAFISSAEIVSGIRAATSSASSENCNGNPFSSNISFIAASLVFSASSTLTTSPTGRLPFCSHSVILTTTLSPSAAPFMLWTGMKISGMGLSISAMKKPKPLFICRWPINSLRLRCNTSFTTPCILLPALRISFMATRTVSPCRAVLKSEGRTIISTSIPSTVTNPIPERVTSSLPFSIRSVDRAGFAFVSFFFFEFFLPIIVFYDCALKFRINSVINLLNLSSSLKRK